MTSDSEELDTARCPHCNAQISTVEVCTLRSVRAKTPVKFWACPDCTTLLASA